MRQSLDLDLPNLLRVGDTVCVVSPSGPVERAKVEAGAAWIESIGLKVLYDEGIFARDGFLAGSDARRIAEFEAALSHPDARAIWAARGGYGATRLLPHVEPERIRNRAKWFIGFSDVTAMHGLWRQAGLSSMHAANVSTVANWSEAARENLRLGLFTGKHPTSKGREGVGHKTVQGTLAGGNLCILCSMLGTPYFPSLRGSVLLLEDVNEPPYKLDRMFTQLTQSGALDRVVGLAVGQLCGCDSGSAQNVLRGEDVVREHALRLGLPAVFGLSVGHEWTSGSALLGAAVTLDPMSAELRYD